MAQFLHPHPFLGVAGFALYFVLLLTAVMWVISLGSGWHALAARYRTDREFPTGTMRLESATMRAGMATTTSFRWARMRRASPWDFLFPFAWVIRGCLYPGGRL